jgi:hypothetical protein
MVRVSYLRSYLPAAALPPYAVAAQPAAESWRGDPLFLWREHEADDAYSASWEGDEYTCPRHFRLRKLEGLLAFNNAFPEAGLIPQSQVTDAGVKLEQLRDSDPLMRSYILTSPWHVPIRWFAAFLHEERELFERGSGVSIRYRTSMIEAQRRVERAVGIVSDAGFDPGVVGQLRSLASWLEDFSADAMLELDYGSVADLFSEGDLVLDESAADVAASLLALEQGDLERAADFYQILMRRWSRAQSLAFSN